MNCLKSMFIFAALSLLLILSFPTDTFAQAIENLVQDWTAEYPDSFRVVGRVGVETYTATYRYSCSANKFTVTAKNQGTAEISVSHDNATLRKIIEIREGSTVRDSTIINEERDYGIFNITGSQGATEWEHNPPEKTNMKVYVYTWGWVCPLDNPESTQDSAYTDYIDYETSNLIADTSDAPLVPQDLQCDNPTSYGYPPQLSWDSSTGAQKYYLYRKKNSGSYSNIAVLVGHTNTTYTDTTYQIGTELGEHDHYYYKVKAYNNQGYSGFSNEEEIVGIDNPEKRAFGVGIPREFYLYSNFPNPFNPVTNFRYQIPKAAHVTLVIYNIMGQEISRLVDEAKPMGFHIVKWDAGRQASGTYFYKIIAGDYIKIRKMILIK
ncbi:T9SS type A sorting domain-containing protein [candidate division KSB1 bacterium]